MLECGWGMGALGFFVIALLLLSTAALVKYLFFGGPRHPKPAERAA